ncbi:peroxidase 4 [Phtheirospermum japonicum]|uniref:Peroxidase n=1 Tax=Phtheirospermum japonicum TaxID=374723 RepID=A0A830CP71_9LAMI|nr:peroxidase 4 [Phtheirospermum japonicum]
MASQLIPCYKLVVITLAIVFLISSSSAKPLAPGFYSTTCSNLSNIVKSVVSEEIKVEARKGAFLLRLHFHDCFVNGCDASILLDGKTGEKNALPNKNSANGFEIIDKIKSAVEDKCPGTVSCADILAIAARDSIVQLGGRGWKVKLGRRDSLSASLAAANNGSIPGPTSSLANLTSRFKQLGLSKKDLVVLSGGHTLGQARCTNFRNRIYNDSNIDESFAKERQDNCSRSSKDDDKLAPLDPTPACFDNTYYKDLINKKGLLHSDQELFGNGNGQTDKMVISYSQDLKAFYKDFGASMIKMGDINPLTESNGEIRKNCRKVNK